MKKIIKKFLNIFTIIYIKIMIKRSKVKHGINFVLNGCPRFSGNVSFGNDCRINSGVKYNPIGGDTKARFIANINGSIIIGNNVGISNSSIISHSQIKIDDYVMIGGSCKIYDTDFHSLDFENRL